MFRFIKYIFSRKTKWDRVQEIKNENARKKTKDQNVVRIPIDPVRKEFVVIRSLSEICATFKEGLTPEERAQFQDISQCDNLLQDLKTQCQSEKGSDEYSKIYKSFNYVETFSLRLRPFFEVVDMIISSHPEVAAIVWGGLKLLFVLARGYVQMFEKVGTMLLTLADNIPRYQREIDAIRRAKQANKVETMYPLVRAMTYVYEDIVGFIKQCCTLFVNQKGKVRSSSKMLLLNVWKPLDIYLGEIIDRLQKHERLLEQEITTFRLNGVIEAIEMREKELDQQSDLTKLETMEKQRKSRVREIRDFLDAPTWEDKLWNTLRRRAKDSGKWLLDQQWFDIACNPSRCIGVHPAFVTIRAKPGYGKTFLCAYIIDHLETRPRITEGPPDQRTMRTQVNYFFFSRLQERFQPSDALRAVAAQLFQQNSEDWNIVKAASLILGNKFNKRASIQDLLDLVRLLLRKQPHFPVWVFDAVDECSRPEEFFAYLSEILTPAVSSPPLDGSCHEPVYAYPSIIIFSRPDTTTPRCFESHTRFFQIDFDGRDNFQDIHPFLLSSLTALWHEGIIRDVCEHNDISALAVRTAEHANGMFLWAALLLRYLSLELLSITDRRNTLTSLKFLEGLDGLYNHILGRIASSHGKAQLERIRNAFQWVARTLSTTPLSLAQLRHAISISPDVSFSHSDVVQLSKESLLRISGALLELGPNERVPLSRSKPKRQGWSIEQLRTGFSFDSIEDSGHVRPIHASVIEYLQDLAGPASDDIPPTFQGIFALHEGIEYEVFYMRCCLNYMSTCIPPGPLSGSTDVTASAEYIKKHYPFLDYACKRWLTHAQSVVTLITDEKGDCKAVEVFLSTMQDFLENSRDIRRWIEALYLCGAQRTLQNIPLFVQKLKEASSSLGTETITQRKLLQFHSDISRFSKDLDQLEREWDAVLRDSPNEIWLPSIPAFEKSSYWTTKDAITHRLQRENGRTVTVDSAASSDGSRLGIVRLRPPRGLLTKQYTLPTRGWQAIYEIWTLDDKKVIYEVLIDIPESHMSRLVAGLRDPAYLNDVVGFLEIDSHEQVADFHVAFSSDLMRILILGTLVVLTPVANQELKPEFNTDTIYFEPWKGLTQRDEFKIRALDAPTWQFRALFHPTGRHLLILRPGDFESCEFAIYDVSKNSLRAAMSSMTVPWDVLPFTNDNKHLYHLLCFHPTKNILLISQIKSVYAWFYDAANGLSVQIRSHGMSELEFSSCGRYVKGSDNFLAKFPGTVTLIDLREIIETVEKEAIEPINSQIQVSPSLGALLQQGVKFRPESFQETGVTYFRSSGLTGVEATLLHQHHDQQAIVLHTLNSDGSAQVQTLARMSRQLLDLNNAIQVPVTQTDQTGRRRIRVVLTRKQHWSFSLGDDEAFTAPVVLERLESSIPTIESAPGSSKQAGWLALEEGD